MTVIQSPKPHLEWLYGEDKLLQVKCDGCGLLSGITFLRKKMGECDGRISALLVRSGWARNGQCDFCPYCLGIRIDSAQVASVPFVGKTVGPHNPIWMRYVERMTDRPRKDSIRRAAGERRAQAYRAIRWAEQQLGACTTDAMRARLLEEKIRRAKEQG